MINLRDIEYFAMTYVFIEEDGDIVYEYEQTSTPIRVIDDNRISFMLKNIDPEEDAEEYVVTLTKKGADEFYLSSSYFEDATEQYPLSVDELVEEIKFTSANDDEVLYLYGFFA
jgi:hypothetical protein